MDVAGLVFELHPPKCVFFEAAQMILLPYFAKSYGFNFEKNAIEFQSILQQSLSRYVLMPKSVFFRSLLNFFCWLQRAVQVDSTVEFYHLLSLVYSLAFQSFYCWTNIYQSFLSFHSFPKVDGMDSKVASAHFAGTSQLC